MRPCMSLSEQIRTSGGFVRGGGASRTGRATALPVDVKAVLAHSAKAACRTVPAFALVFALLVPVHTIWLEQHLGERTAIAVVIFFVGGLCGGFVAWILAALVARGRAWSARFSAAMILNAVLVPLATAFVFFLQYRLYYSQWHGAAFSEIWFWQIAFTGAASVYLFMVSAVQYIFPLGLGVLVGVSILFCKWSKGLGAIRGQG